MYIEGQITAVKDISRDQIIRGCSNAIHGVGSFIQIAAVAEHISNPWGMFATGIATSFFALAGTNFVLSAMSRETLVQLQLTMIMVEDLNDQIKKIRTIVEKALNFVADKNSDDAD